MQYRKKNLYLQYHKKNHAMTKTIEGITKEDEEKWIRTMNNRIAPKIKAARLQQGLSQMQLAFMANTSSSVINSLENNPIYNSKIGTLLKISNALGISLA